jgi:hypothetical protein
MVNQGFHHVRYDLCSRQNEEGKHRFFLNFRTETEVFVFKLSTYGSSK